MQRATVLLKEWFRAELATVTQQLLDENVCVSGRMNEDRVDVPVMATASVATPAMAEAAMTAFRAERFRFHTGG